MIDKFEKIQEQIKKASDSYSCTLLETSMWNLLEAREKIDELIREIGYPRFEPQKTVVMHTPVPSKRDLRCCDICGKERCQSDHK